MPFDPDFGFIKDQDLLASLKDLLQRTTKASGDLKPFWTSIANQANKSAYQDVVSGLVGRGYSIDQIVLWDRGVEFQTAIGLWWCLEFGLSMDSESYNEIALEKEKLDRREELKLVNFTTLGIFIDPKTKYGGPTTSIYDTRRDMFILDPDDSRIGQVTRF